MYKYIDLTVEAYEEYFAISFSSEGVLLNSIMEIHCSTAKGVTDQNRMAVRDWWSKFFTLQRSFIQDYAFCDVFIHRFNANDYVMFQAIWNEYRGVKKHSDFLMNNNLRKRSINNKLFIDSVKIHKDFFKLIYHSYGL